MTLGVDEWGYVVELPDEGTATVTANDGTTDSFSPKLITRWDAAVETANVETELIDGSIAVTLVGDRTATGTLTMLFTSDGAMQEARSLLARRTSFTLTEPTRPVINMTFVRSGTLTPGMHDEIRDVWEFEVGFREVLL